MKTKWRDDDDDDEGGKNVGHKFVCIYFIAFYETIFFHTQYCFFFVHLYASLSHCLTIIYRL